MARLAIADMRKQEDACFSKKVYKDYIAFTQCPSVAPAFCVFAVSVTLVGQCNARASSSRRVILWLAIWARGSSEPGLGIDVINLGGFDGGEGDGHGFAAAL